jgi:hypothetical protein
MNWYETSAKLLEKTAPESVAEVRHLFKVGNDIKAISEYTGWSQWTIAELLGEKLS